MFIRQFRAWYVKYAAFYGASFDGLRFLIVSKLSNQWHKNIIFTLQLTQFSKPLAEF
jgi:hypothetical protein